MDGCAAALWLLFAKFEMLFVFVVDEKMKIFVCDERTHQEGTCDPQRKF